MSYLSDQEIIKKTETFKETLIYSNQHQTLRLNMLKFQGCLALPLTGESFNQCFPKDVVFYAVLMEKRKEEEAYLVTGNLKHYPVCKCQALFYMTW